MKLNLILNNRRFRRTFILTIILCVITAIIIVFLQLKLQSTVKVTCSYLDPPIIDYIAFISALFLFFEGWYRIFENAGSRTSSQSTRIIRILIGCGVAAIHVIQFIHK